tara:strand:+ start:182 stop:361 length:180 start_codon:yes stop_codon:yes gene_type:complete
MNDTEPNTRNCHLLHIRALIEHTGGRDGVVRLKNAVDKLAQLDDQHAGDLYWFHPDYEF